MISTIYKPDEDRDSAKKTTSISFVLFPKTALPFSSLPRSRVSQWRVLPGLE